MDANSCQKWQFWQLNIAQERGQCCMHPSHIPEAGKLLSPGKSKPLSPPPPYGGRSKMSLTPLA